MGGVWMPKTIQIGSFMIQMDWIYLLITLFIVFFYIQKQVKDRESIINAIENSLLLTFIIWKFSIFLLQPTLLKSPMNLLYFDGGSKGLVVGVIGTLIYISFAFKKYNWKESDIKIVIEGIFLSVFLFSSLKVFEQGSSIPYGITLIVTSILAWFFLKWSKESCLTIYLWFAVVLFIAELVLINRPTVILGMTTNQIILLLVVIFLYVVDSVSFSKDKKEAPQINSRVERKRLK